MIPLLRLGFKATATFSSVHLLTFAGHAIKPSLLTAGSSMTGRNKPEVLLGEMASVLALYSSSTITPARFQGRKKRPLSEAPLYDVWLSEAGSKHAGYAGR